METNPEQLAAASAKAEISLILLYVLNPCASNSLFLSLNIYTHSDFQTRYFLSINLAVAFPMITI